MQVAVGRRDDPDVRVADARAAEALELALLEHAEQLGLHRRRHLADLVEEQHAAAGLLDPSRLRRDRAGERAALVAEQLRLEQLVGKRRAVDGDERPVLAARSLVNEARDDFLAGARLAGEEHRGFRLRDARRVRQDVLPLRRMADHAALAGARLELAGQRGDLRLELRRRLARGGVAAVRLGQPLVRERQRQQVRHAAREAEVRLAEARRLARQEEERSEDAGAERHRHAQRRPHAQRARTCGPRTLPGAISDVVSWTTYGSRWRSARSFSVQDRRRPERRVVHLRAGHRVHAERLAVVGPRRQRQDVVRQRARGRRRRPPRRCAGCRAPRPSCGSRRSSVSSRSRRRRSVLRSASCCSASASRSAMLSIRIWWAAENASGWLDVNQSAPWMLDAAADRADDPRARIRVDRRRRRRGRIGNAVPGDLHLAVGARRRTARPSRRDRGAGRAGARTESPRGRSSPGAGRARRARPLPPRGGPPPSALPRHRSEALGTDSV